ncbi:MAG: amidohydrolase family protein [Rhodospirillaceae bacterium]|nr:amidohydrolase family protein [Rhodospirillaceae bacterium]MBT6139302.1 amidohydrolase family protein [Rhodospirillaceae bacterium]
MTSGSGLVIDMHCHLLPERLVALLRARDRAPCIEPDGTGGERIRIFRAAMPFDASDNDPDNRARTMDGFGVSMQVISLPGLFGIDSLPVDEALPLVQAFNDGMAEIVAAHPDRYRAIAALPLGDTEAMAVELRRARTDLSLAGAILPANGFVSLAAAEAWRPVFEEADKLGGHLFIHPGPLPSELVGKAVDAPAPHSDTIEHRRVTLDTQHRLGEVMVTLALTDFLEPYNHLTVHVANLGGTLPFLIERMDHLDMIRHAGEPTASERLRPVAVDTASLGEIAVDTAVRALGAENVLFGTDHPIFRTDYCLNGVVGGVAVKSGRDKVLGANAARLLGL